LPQWQSQVSPHKRAKICHGKGPSVYEAEAATSKASRERARTRECGLQAMSYEVPKYEIGMMDSLVRSFAMQFSAHYVSHGKEEAALETC